MKILVACEESQAVVKELRRLGHEAYSCDIQECSGGRPEAIENTTPMKICRLPTPTQVIQPYQFGHPYSKRTCLWLKGLPPLNPTKIIEEYRPWVHAGSKDSNGNPRKKLGVQHSSKMKSKTFPGVAKAMAEQWVGLNIS